MDLMAVLPSLIRRDEKNYTDENKTSKQILPVHLVSIFPRIHTDRNKASLNPRADSDTHLATTARKLPRPLPDTKEVARFGSSSLHACCKCGLKFRAALLSLHEQRCNRTRGVRRKRTLGKRAQARRTSVRNEMTDQVERYGALKKEPVVHKTDLTSTARLPVLVPNWTPTCRFCGEKFRKHSILLHEKMCLKRASRDSISAFASHFISKDAIEMPDSSQIVRMRQSFDTTTGPLQPKKLDVVLDLLPRPHTQKLNRSTLVDRGYSIPTIDGSTRERMISCQTCGREVMCNEMSVHKKTCRPQPVAASKGLITFPLVMGRGGRTTVINGVQEVGQGPTYDCRHGEQKLTKKPRTVLCYTCGREYGTKSISIHKPQCLKRFEMKNQNLPVSEKKYFVKESKINAQAVVHETTCRAQPVRVAKGVITFPVVMDRGGRVTGTDGLIKVGQGAISGYGCGEQKQTKKPQAVLCYICGREYGTKSISIHEPQCLKKFETENRKLPIGERMPLPKKPVNTPALCTVTTGVGDRTTAVYINAYKYREDYLQDTAEEYFQHCYREFEKELIPCKKCGRKFAPERHKKHAHKCKAGPLKQVQSTPQN